MKNTLVPPEEVGRRLIALRGLQTRTGTARAIGITNSELAFFERGLRTPSDEKKILIANYYGKTVQQIFFAND